MVRKLWLVPMAALALMLVPSFAQAQFRQGDWELTLAGSGSNGPDFDGVALAVNGSLGFFIADPLELGVRQSLTYEDFTGSAWTGSTRAFLDFHFDIGRLQPFVGANIGFVYGDNVHDTWAGAPEAGVKYFVDPNTIIFFMAEYQFFFDQDNSFDNSFSDGQFVYTLGLGWRF